MQRSRITCGALAMAAGLVLAAPAAGQGYWYNSQDSAQNQSQNRFEQREQMQRQEELRRQRAQNQARQGQSNSSDQLYFDTRQNQPSRQDQRWNQQQYRGQDSRAMQERQRRMEIERWNQANRQRDRNPYGVGEDVADDKWDTGLWDMGEYDVPRQDRDVDRWLGTDRESQRNPYGTGRDVFDDKWDTGLDDMGEYNAWDYPQQYRRDLDLLRRGEFYSRYGVPQPEDRRVGQLRDDDVWDPNEDRPTADPDRNRWLGTDRESERNPYGQGGDIFDDKWDTGLDDVGEYNAGDYPEQYRRDLDLLRRGEFFSRYGVAMPEDRRVGQLRDDDVWDPNQDRAIVDPDRNRWLGTDRESQRNPYGQGRDVFDDKWDTGLDDMGEYNAWDYPEQYQRDLDLLRRGEFHSRYGVPQPEGRQERGGQLRDDDQWDGRQPWYQRGEGNPNPAIRRRNDWW